MHEPSARVLETCLQEDMPLRILLLSGPAAACATVSSMVQRKGGIHEYRKLSCGTTAAQGHTGDVWSSLQI